jgi:LemA protein
MSKSVKIGCGVVAAVVVIFVLYVFATYKTTWDNLNKLYQETEGGKSAYASALDNCSQKIEGVWTIADQYMKHESETFKAVAEARSGYRAALDSFNKAKASGQGTQELTKFGTQAVNSALAFNVQIEAYPNLKAVETSQENIRNMEESVNEIKTALDDWIFTIKDYNTYRSSFWGNIIGGFIPKFPAEIKYYEDTVKELDVNKLNPQK